MRYRSRLSGGPFLLLLICKLSLADDVEQGVAPNFGGLADQNSKNGGSVVIKRGHYDHSNCRNKFEVHSDKIIRTQDSKALGAKYLNEKDVNSRDECMQLCCNTDDCDVFIFEEVKVPGGCYLFQCGPPEDFKCKFTKYNNYSSGFMSVDRHLHELESQMKYSLHELELTKLRDTYEKQPSQTGPSNHKTTPSPKSKEVIQQYGAEPLNEQPSANSKGCSRNQFECHSTGECLAIYNACDGIPQCADGSDESPELGCPSPQLTTLPPPRHTHPTPIPIRHHEIVPETSGNGDSGSGSEMSGIPVRKQWPAREDYGAKTLGTENERQASNMNLPDISRAEYGREGEELPNYRGPAELAANRWPSTQYRHEPAGSQIFAHKGEGLVPQNSYYQQQQHYVPSDPQPRAGLPYNDPRQVEYAKYLENVRYNRLYGQGSSPTNWQPSLKSLNLNVPELPGQNPEEVPPGRPDVPQGSPYSDYYYEEMYKNKLAQQKQQAYVPVPQVSYQPQQPEVPAQLPVQPKEPEVKYPKTEPQVTKPANVIQTTSAPHADSKGASSSLNSVSNIIALDAASLVTSLEGKEKDAGKAHGHEEMIKSSHRRLDKLNVDLRESVFGEEEVRSNSPRGAILSLTMGLCVTGIMLILVGCRMRMVTKRMRRGGKGYAHDADFLVNGMYL